MCEAKFGKCADLLSLLLWEKYPPSHTLTFVEVTSDWWASVSLEERESVSEMGLSFHPIDFRPLLSSPFLPATTQGVVVASFPLVDACLLKQTHSHHTHTRKLSYVTTTTTQLREMKEKEKPHHHSLISFSFPVSSNEEGAKWKCVCAYNNNDDTTTCVFEAGSPFLNATTRHADP